MLEKKTFQTLDLYISAYLSMNGLPPELEIINNRVIFVFQQSDVLYKLLSKYNANMDVGVCDFVVAIKTLRGQMLSMKQVQR